MRLSNKNWPLLASVVVVSTLAACASSMATKNDMSFFVSSKGSGNGANLGGIEGADRICQSLAGAAGAGGRTWHAYLSAVAPTGGQSPVNARDRIGKGPWRNANGVVIANDLAQLHGTNNLTKQTALTETGAVVNGRGDTPNMHDILTGSQPDGTAIAGGADTTCGNWTRSGEGAAMLGHSDRTGLDETAPAKSWNSSHQSRGCSQEALKGTGGDGRLYCFAVN
ncbi:MAG: hypothetical protein ABIV63_17045 [Caldimonas sp.]